MPMFSICFHHGGNFCNNGGLKYVGGQAEIMDGCDTDIISFWDLKKEISSVLKYKNVLSLYYKVPGISLELGIKRLYSNNEVVEMINMIKESNQIEMFVEHDVDKAVMPNEIGLLPCPDGLTSVTKTLFDQDCIIVDMINEHLGSLESGMSAQKPKVVSNDNKDDDWLEAGFADDELHRKEKNVEIGSDKIEQVENVNHDNTEQV